MKAAQNKLGTLDYFLSSSVKSSAGTIEIEQKNTL